jgi:hypothetical protein
MTNPVTSVLIAVVIAVGVVPVAFLFILSTIHKERNSAYLAPGMLSACLFSPVVAVIIGVLRSIHRFRGMESTAAMSGISFIFRDVNKPLVYSLVLAIFLCGFSTFYFRLKVLGKPPASKQSRIPAIFSIIILATSVIPFLIYHRGQRLILHVAPGDNYFGGRDPKSVALEIAAHMMAALFTSALAALVITALFIVCTVFYFLRKDMLTESHVFYMYSADIVILLGIIAMSPWL